MTTDEQIQLINRFYSSFQQRDHTGMIACYHPQVEFSDPVFGPLEGKQVAAMWHMLCERGTDLQIQFTNVRADGSSGQAHWEATYTFSGSGRRVHNSIDAAFEFEGGSIIHHRDEFDVWRWTRMALGTMGVLLGWSPLVQNKVRHTAVAGLHKFVEKHPEYQR